MLSAAQVLRVAVGGRGGDSTSVAGSGLKDSYHVQRRAMMYVSTRNQDRFWRTRHIVLEHWTDGRRNSRKMF